MCNLTRYSVRWKQVESARKQGDDAARRRCVCEIEAAVTFSPGPYVAQFQNGNLWRRHRRRCHRCKSSKEQ
jgi:hypothetical protein